MPARWRSSPGAFPEPFLHGYDGKARPAVVRFAPGLRAGRGESAAPPDDRRRAPRCLPAARRKRLRAGLGPAAPHRGHALAGSRPVRRGAVLVRGRGGRPARRSLRAQVREPVSAGPATALLAAVAVAAFLLDRAWALAAHGRRAARRLPPCTGAAPLAVPRRRLSGALGVILISPLTWSSGGGTLLWEGPRCR